MSKKKQNRAAAAAVGTKVDPNRGAASALAAEGASVSRASDATSKIVHAEWAPHMNSQREKLTGRIFTTVEIVLIAVPIVMIGMFVGAKGSLTSDNLSAYFSEDPTFAVSFLAACLQPFAAYLLRLVYRKYGEGDAGYVAGNLIVLLCSEMLLSSVPGIVGMALLLWRVWKNVSAHFTDWMHERRLGGVLFDISGALVLFVFAAICAFASSRLMAS